MKRTTSGILAKTGLTINQYITPLTQNQKLAFEAHSKGKHLVLNGFPGTGKTFLAIYFAILDVLNKNSPIDKIVIIRPPVGTVDMGFMPGDLKEKMEPYTPAYIDIVNEIFGRGDAYAQLEKYDI